MERSNHSARNEKVAFIWLRELINCYSRMYTAVLREICAYMDDCITLVQLSPTAMREFCVTESVWRAPIGVSLAQVYSREGRYISLLNRSVLYTGGLSTLYAVNNRALDTALLLTYTGSLELLPSLHIPRYLHGLVVYQSQAYVFGGLGTSSEGEEIFILQCERLSLREKAAWNALPDLSSARAGYNPCEWRREIWICGGRNSSIEVFSPISQSFRVLSLSFPDKAPTLSFVIGEDLLVFSRRHAVTISVGAGDKYLVESRTSLLGKFEPTSELAVWKQDAWVMQSNKCARLDGFSGVTIDLFK